MTTTGRQSICSECGEPLSELWRKAGGCPYCGARVNGAVGGRGFVLGTTGYCFSGKGWIVAPLGVALPVLAMYLCIVCLYDCFVLPSAFLIPSGSSWIAAGTTCWVLGRMWNHGRASHDFMGFRVESWGPFYFISGMLMLLPILLAKFDPMTTGEPGPLRLISMWTVGLASIGCFLLQLTTLLFDLACLLVWIPIYIVKLITSFRTQPTETRIHHEHC